MATKNIAAPYTAAPATTPTPIPTDEGRTGEEELESELPGAPWSFGLELELPEADEGLTGVPPGFDVSARTGIDGSTMLMSVCTDGLGLMYSFEFGFRSSKARGSTISEGI